MKINLDITPGQTKITFVAQDDYDAMIAKTISEATKNPTTKIILSSNGTEEIA